jgi:hypothetical protein
MDAKAQSFVSRSFAPCLEERLDNGDTAPLGFAYKMACVVAAELFLERLKMQFYQRAYMPPKTDSLWPNKSPQPTRGDAFSSAIAVHVASRRWLSFFR